MASQSRIIGEEVFIIVFVFVFFGLINTISIFTNLGQYIYGNMPVFSGLVISVICLLFWAGIGAYYGYQKNKKFLILSAVFWVGGIFLYLLALVPQIGNWIGLPAFIVTSTLYGLRYIIPMQSGEILNIVLHSIVYFICALSFGTGYYFSKKMSPKAEPAQKNANN